MIMCKQDLVKFCPIEPKLNLTSLKGRNSVAKFAKNDDLQSNVDLVNDKVYTKFG